MNKLPRLFVSVLFCAVIVVDCPAGFIEIGTGTDSGHKVPVDGLWDYSWSQVIYLQQEIGNAMEIGGLAYFVADSPPKYLLKNQRIYLKHTSLTSFPNADYDDPNTSGFTLVFEGDVLWDGSGWQQVTLDTPFLYNGSDHLIVYWQNHDGDPPFGYPNFRYSYGDNRAKSENGIREFPLSSGLRRDYVANIQLHEPLSGPGGATNQIGRASCRERG